MSHHLSSYRLPVACPSCGQQAEILDRFTMGSTDGPVDHLKTRCADGHWYTLPAERVAVYVAGPQALAA
jgi:rRNA maturation protein Nop10